LAGLCWSDQPNAGHLGGMELAAVSKLVHTAFCAIRWIRVPERSPHTKFPVGKVSTSYIYTGEYQGWLYIYRFRPTGDKSRFLYVWEDTYICQLYYTCMCGTKVFVSWLLLHGSGILHESRRGTLDWKSKWEKWAMPQGWTGRPGNPSENLQYYMKNRYVEPKAWRAVISEMRAYLPLFVLSFLAMYIYFARLPCCAIHV